MTRGLGRLDWTGGVGYPRRLTGVAVAESAATARPRHSGRGATMDGSFGPALQVYRTATPVEPVSIELAPVSRGESPDDLFDRESLRSRHVRRRPVTTEPYSPAWFEAIESQR